MRSQLKMTGKYMFEAVENGRVIGRTEYSNLITNGIYENVLKFLNYSEESSPPANDILDVSYFALGTGTTAPAITDATLETETFRKIYTQKSWTGLILTAVTQLTASEANFNIKEVGIFAGGSAVADSGLLLSRTIVDITKNSNIVYNVYWVLALSEVS